MEEVQKRARQAVKKNRILLFQWRGGYLTKEILRQFLDIFKEEAERKNKQAVVCVRFLDGVGEGQLQMEEHTL